jgi:hypothetical protein
MGGFGPPAKTPLVWITFKNNGAFLNADLADSDGEAVLQIRDNMITINRDNVYSVEQRPDDRIPPDQIIVTNRAWRNSNGPPTTGRDVGFQWRFLSRQMAHSGHATPYGNQSGRSPCWVAGCVIWCKNCDSGSQAICLRVVKKSDSGFGDVASHRRQELGAGDSPISQTRVARSGPICFVHMLPRRYPTLF